MQAQIQSEQEENKPIRGSEENQNEQLNKQQDRVQSSSIPVNEKTRLPPESNINLKQAAFQEVSNVWPQQAPFAFPNIVAQQIQSEVNQGQQSSAQQSDNQQIMSHQSMQFAEGSKIPNHLNLTQTPKMRHSQQLQCRWCNQAVFSQIENKIGLAQLILCLIFLPAFGIGLMFVCCNTYKDCYHYCSQCSGEMGVVKLIDFEC
ncbi:unnamed protein product (macronuclear) [Paramecium tetraurelia]|uniref:LITAF domain-containing protein n=1 Tax=Paramecium tetraurelia TaxID=5888 RepID=A0E0J4_PARTE|nr:uncharacterized protein GSPATT00021979001 [Paramecium tetraurelia]CAK88811.1 unnamed protein product [Paramecium tetraurelia]|eukprot:XP_001456208.1 hypothetical protein (macronuclear) [Paramecium tetraurelia strain d4-2]